MAELSRRRFFGFLAAPAIVRAASLMPVRALLPEFEIELPPVYNGLLTPGMITQETLAILRNNLIAAGKVDRLFADRYFRIGSNITIRKPLRIPSSVVLVD